MLLQRLGYTTKHHGIEHGFGDGGTNVGTGNANAIVASVQEASGITVRYVVESLRGLQHTGACLFANHRAVVECMRSGAGGDMCGRRDVLEGRAFVTYRHCLPVPSLTPHN